MRKLFYSINVTIDGFADHTIAIPDDELHEFYADLIARAGIVLFGRKTYELLQSYWPEAPKDPSATKGMLEFARIINSQPKIVFSGTLDKVDWSSAELVKGDAVEEIIKLKQKPGNDLSVGGISLATELMKEGLIDEYWFVVHPVIAGKGRRLFENLNKRVDLELVDKRQFNSGVMVLHYINKR